MEKRSNKGKFLCTPEGVFRTKCLYTPKGAAREYAAVGCNFYRGCPYQCVYCYNRKGLTSKIMGVDHAVLESRFISMKYRPKKYRELSGEDYAFMVFREEVTRHLDYLRTVGIFFSFSTDPMCPDAFGLTWRCATYASLQGVPVRILTKNAELPQEVFEIAKAFGSETLQRIAIGFTLTGCDDQEPNASPNAERINVMRTVRQLGYQTFASIEPVIDFISSYDMVREAVTVCDFFMIGLLSHFGSQDSSEQRTRAEWFFHRVDALMQVFGIRVYYKDSVRKLYGQMLDSLHGRHHFAYQFLSDVYETPPSLNIFQRLTNAIYYMNCANGYLLGFRFSENNALGQRTEKDEQFMLFMTLWCYRQRVKKLQEYVQNQLFDIEQSHDEARLEQLKTDIMDLKIEASCLNLYLANLKDLAIESCITAPLEGGFMISSGDHLSLLKDIGQDIYAFAISSINKISNYEDSQKDIELSNDGGRDNG